MEKKINKHKEICCLLNETYKKKNHDYGDSFGDTGSDFPEDIPF